MRLSYHQMQYLVVAEIGMSHMQFPPELLIHMPTILVVDDYLGRI